MGGAIARSSSNQAKRAEQRTQRRSRATYRAAGRLALLDLRPDVVGSRRVEAARIGLAISVAAVDTRGQRSRLWDLRAITARNARWAARVTVGSNCG
jgi:hypothetical protein